MTQYDPTPQVPVFRLVPETRDLPPAVRFRLAVRMRLVEQFEPPPPTRQEMN